MKCLQRYKVLHRPTFYLRDFVDEVEAIVVPSGDRVAQEGDVLQLFKARQAVQVGKLLHQVVGQEETLQVWQRLAQRLRNSPD